VPKTWSLSTGGLINNTGAIYLECIALVIEKDGLSTQVFT